MAGARIVVARPEGHRDPEYLARLIEERRVTTTHFVPSMLGLFLEQDGLRDTCAGLRRVFCSGEALSHNTVADFTAKVDCELHNLYGPTEAAIDVSAWTATTDYPGRIVPIGKPIANTHLYVLDGDLRLLPIGMPGELCIGGVVVPHGQEGRRSLVAYVVAVGFDKDMAVKALQQRLPEYMVPRRYVELPSLPLGANGKRDRKALPAPHPSSAVEPSRDALPPEADPTGLTDRIRAIGAELLGAEVGPHDEFFRLGMDSITAIRLVTRIRRLGAALELTELYEHSTPDALAARLRSGPAPADAAGPVPFALTGRPRGSFAPGIVDAYPVTAIQREMIRHFDADPGRAAYHDVFGYRFRLPLDADALRACLQRIVDRHDSLRTSFELDDAEPLQLVHERVAVEVNVVDARPGDEARGRYAEWFEAEKGNRFAWDRPGQMRFTAHRLDEREFMLSLSFHHAIIDGWSLSLLIKEFVDLYTRALEGRLPGAGEPTLPYRHYVALEVGDRHSAAARRFWTEYLAGVEPQRLPGPPAGGTPERWSETRRALLSLARDGHVPLKQVLLAVHVIALARLHETETVLTHVFTGGRPEEEGADAVFGMFLNFTPLRANTFGHSSASLAAELFAQERRSLPHRRFPLPDIEGALGVDRLADTVFNFTRFPSYGEVIRRGALRDVTFFEHTHFPLLVNVGDLEHDEEIVLTFNADGRRVSAQRLADIAGLYRRVIDETAEDA